MSQSKLKSSLLRGFSWQGRHTPSLYVLPAFMYDKSEVKGVLEYQAKATRMFTVETARGVRDRLKEVACR